MGTAAALPSPRRLGRRCFVAVDVVPADPHAMGHVCLGGSHAVGFFHFLLGVHHPVQRPGLRIVHRLPDERTSVFAWKNYFQLFGTFSAAWFYWFCLRPVFGNEVVGARWLSLLVGIVMIGATFLTFALCRERRLEKRQPSIPIGEALKLTIKNRPFMLLQGAQQMLALGMGSHRNPRCLRPHLLCLFGQQEYRFLAQRLGRFTHDLHQHGSDFLRHLALSPAGQT